MSGSDTSYNDLRPLIEKIVHDIIQEKGYVFSKEQLATKEDLKGLATKEDLIQVIKLFEKRFEAIDKRFEDMNRRYEELREDMNRRFEAVDKRFEEIIAQMDKRFEAIDKRFEDINKRFEQVDKRFEQMDRRFEEMNRRFELMVGELKELIKTQQESFKQLRKDVHSMGSRFGRRLENVVKELMDSMVKEFGVDLQKAKKLVLVDHDGVVVSQGDVTDIDVYVSDGETYCIEVKAYVDHHDVYNFYKKATILAPKEGIKCSKLLIIALEASEKAKEYCAKYKITLIHGEEKE